MLDDHPFCYHHLSVLTDIGLVQGVIDIPPGGGEVGKIHHGDKVEVAFEDPCVVSPLEIYELGYHPQPIQSLPVGLSLLIGHTFDPAHRDHLAEHRHIIVEPDAVCGPVGIGPMYSAGRGYPTSNRGQSEDRT